MMTSTISREMLIDIVGVGIRAISVYNSQPWHFALVKNGIDVYFTREKKFYLDLEPTPYIEMGAVVENLTEGAASHNLETNLQMLSPVLAQGKPFVKLLFHPGSRGPKDIRHVLERTTNRNAYASTPIPVKIQRELAMLSDDSNIHIAFWSGHEKHRLADILTKLDQIRFSNYHLIREVMQNIRVNPTESEEYRDQLDARNLSIHFAQNSSKGIAKAVQIWGRISSFPLWYYLFLKLSGYFSFAAQRHVKLLRQNGTMMVFIMKKQDNESFFNLGRIVQRILNDLTRRGFASMSVLSGISLLDTVQEHTEIFSKDQIKTIEKARYDIKRLFDLYEQKIAFIIRAGNAEPLKQLTYRRNIESFLMTHEEKI